MNTKKNEADGQSMIPLKIRFDDGYRSFSISEEKDGAVGIPSLSGAVEINGMLVTLAQCEDATVSSEIVPENGASFYVDYHFARHHFIWRWEFVSNKQSVNITARIKNTGDTPLALKNWHVICCENESEVVIRLGEDEGNTRFFRWCPWDMCVETLSSCGGKHSSSNLLHLYNPALGMTLLCGFVTLDRMGGRHHVQYSEGVGINKYGALCSFGEYMLPPGKEIASETLSISLHTDPYEALEYWASRVQEIYRPELAEQPPVGWIGGWSYSPEECCESFVLRNARAIREKLAGFDVGYIWISQKRLKDYIPGNWMKSEESQIPSGLECFFLEMGNLGFKPGLWVAPFWFYAEAEGMLEKCRDFLLRDAAGNPVTHEEPWGWDNGDNLPWYHMHKYYLRWLEPQDAGFCKEFVRLLQEDRRAVLYAGFSEYRGTREAL